MTPFLGIALSNALVAGLLALAAAASGRWIRRPALTHALWLLVLLKLLTPPFMQIPVVTLPADPSNQVAALEQAHSVEGKCDLCQVSVAEDCSGIASSQEQGEPSQPSDLAAGEFVAVLPTTMSTSEPVRASESDAIETRSAGGSTAANDLSAFARTRAILLSASVFVWIAGSILVAALAALRSIRFCRLLKCGIAAPGWLRDEVERLGKRIGLPRVPAISLVPGAVPPLLWCVGCRPRLILPEELLTRMDPQQREATLLHELVHLKRRDHWVRFLELAASCCYWWFPVVWWARREIYSSEEACCDAWVVRYSSNGGWPYARALLATIDFLSKSRPAMLPAASQFGRVESLRQRLTMILEGNTSPRLSAKGRLAVIFLATGLLPLWPTISEGRVAVPDRELRVDKLPDTTPDLATFVARSSSGKAFPEPTQFEATGQTFMLDVPGIRSLAYSEDGRFLVVAHGGYRSEGIVRLWETEAGTERVSWKEPKGIGSVHVSPDGSLVVSQSLSDYLVRIRSVASREEILAIHVGSKSARVRFSPDGSVLATATTGGELKLWYAADGTEMRRVATLPFNLQCVAFSADGTRIVAGGGPFQGENFGWAGVWDVGSGKQIAEMKGMPDSVLGIAISADGTLVATAGRDGVARLWQVETSALVATLVGHQDRLESVDFSPDGKTLVSSSYDGTAKLWKVDSGRELATLPGYDGTVMAARFSPDGRTLAIGGSEGVARLWDVATRRLVAALHSGLGDVPQPVQAVAHSPTQAIVAAAHSDGTIRLREPPTGRLVHVLRGHDGVVHGIAFGPAGRVLASAGSDRVVKLWDVESGREIAAFRGHSGPVLCVAFSPDGKEIASGGADCQICLWDTASGRLKTVLNGHSAKVHSVAYAPSGRLLASGSGDGTTRIWNTETHDLRATLRGHLGNIRAVAFSPDGRSLATAGRDATIRLWNPEDGRLRLTLPGHAGMIQCLAFSPRGRTLASGGQDAAIRLWDPESGELRGTLQGHRDSVTTLAFTPDITTLISGGEDQTVRYWMSLPPRYPAIASLEATEKNARCRFAILSSDGRVMITAGDDRVIRVWDMKNGLLLRSDEYQGGTPICGALTPDGSLLATGTYGQTVHLWDVSAGKRVGELEVGEKKLYSIDFSPDGANLAVASAGGTVSVWNVETRQMLWRSEKQSLPMVGVSFSPDGRLLAATTHDWKEHARSGEVRLWDAQSGEGLATLAADGLGLTRPRFSPDGELVLVGSGDGMLRVWEVNSRQLRTTISTSAYGPVTYVAFLPDGKTVSAAHPGGAITLWDIDLRRPLVRYDEPAGQVDVHDLSVSADGSFMVSAGSDGAIRLWPANADLSERPAATTERVGSWPDRLTVGPNGETTPSEAKG